ncbi:MAG TPA: hypothetical protein VFO37_14775, partial [Chitinophagaceae bacterium]|nr:hypothetical protein [Chitinophagaceae bacterium]
QTGIDDWLLPVFLSIIAVTIKLSATPVLLTAIPAAIIFLKSRKIKLLMALAIISTVSFFPFIARNIISSGYVVFPSTAIDLANVDWKYNQELTIREKNYITAYAKRPGVETKDEIDSAAKMTPSEWMPGWWSHRSIADKIILCLFVLSFLAALFSPTKILRSGFVAIFILLTMLTGIIFWFVNAPDPRFGFGQILGFIAIVAYLILQEKELAVKRSILSGVLVVFTVLVVAYTGYRFINFFNKDQLLSPLGIEKALYKTFECDGLKFNSPIDNDDFGTIPIPCTDLNCENFSPRGNKITDGFRAK